MPIEEFNSLIDLQGSQFFGLFTPPRVQAEIFTQMEVFEAEPTSKVLLEA